MNISYEIIYNQFNGLLVVKEHLLEEQIKRQASETLLLALKLAVFEKWSVEQAEEIIRLYKEVVA